MKYEAVLIAGPTASGKSAAAIALAEHVSGAVVNADSMQVYRGLRVLTARPSLADELRVPHLLYGHIEPEERYSAGRYAGEAASVLAAERSAGRIPIFTGGTGLYFDVLENGLSPMPQIPAVIRARVRSTFQRMGREAFAQWLYARDPPLAARIPVSDTQRLLRAADMLEATGTPLSSWLGAKERPILAGLRVARFVIAPPREVLWQRSAARVEAMFAGAAIEEAHGLLHLDPTLPAARALGLREALRCLKGEISLEQAMEDTKTATRQYVKRQTTWLRNRMKDWIWLESASENNNIIKLKENFL